MSAYRGRHGPNLSALLGNLNSVDPSYNTENFGTEDIDELAMFTNTDFVHFDMQQPLDDAFNFELNAGKPENNVKYEELLSAQDPGQNFNLPSLNPVPSDGAPFYAAYNTPIQPAPAGYSPLENRSSPATSTSGALQPPYRTGEGATVEPGSPDDKSRFAAEEDKRRRNTAASARFRVKKKQREQALERTVKDINDKNSKLEAKIHQLEMENKWLKELITEKNGMSSKEEMAAAYQKFRKDSEERDVEGSEHTTGVGTN